MQNLLDHLASFEFPNVFNPWKHDDPMDAAAGGAIARRERLTAHFDCSPVLILVGEAPGYQGCHFSGVPFTNESLILNGMIPRVSSTFRISTRDRPWCEPAATVVWGALHNLGLADRVILWNAFAWHPHEPDNRLSNRTPLRQEVESGLPALRAMLAHFAGVPVLPVGRVAARAFKKIGVSTLPAVRHPSMGGANEFCEGLSRTVQFLQH